MRYRRLRRVPQLGGVVSVSVVRDRSGESYESFAVSWRSGNGDLQWLSPQIQSEEAADAAAFVLSEFIGGTKK